VSKLNVRCRSAGAFVLLWVLCALVPPSIEAAKRPVSPTDDAFLRQLIAESQPVGWQLFGLGARSAGAQPNKGGCVGCPAYLCLCGASCEAVYPSFCACVAACEFCTCNWRSCSDDLFPGCNDT
jgi:hypothetical protein